VACCQAQACTFARSSARSYNAINAIGPLLSLESLPEDRPRQCPPHPQHRHLRQKDGTAGLGPKPRLSTFRVHLMEEGRHHRVQGHSTPVPHMDPSVTLPMITGLKSLLVALVLAPTLTAQAIGVHPPHMRGISRTQNPECHHLKEYLAALLDLTSRSTRSSSRHIVAFRDRPPRPILAVRLCCNPNESTRGILLAWQKDDPRSRAISPRIRRLEIPCKCPMNYRIWLRTSRVLLALLYELFVVHILSC
jgi:hypothetical protein